MITLAENVAAQSCHWLCVDICVSVYFWNVENKNCMETEHTTVLKTKTKQQLFVCR